ncbi:hypothetical protein GCM10010260_78520 [Streptomyces filipinensis]|uniref:Uncharacterized protein n=1 Tax=Streptomyces filipinensis TaxID=66887 RepID=A0A918MG65_9ACTN|nr:hypothetical protein GCM10010260_78520 [Streptomyces filipinensis]
MARELPPSEHGANRESLPGIGSAELACRQPAAAPRDGKWLVAALALAWATQVANAFM